MVAAGLLLFSLAAAQESRKNGRAPRIEPKADTVLKQMSEQLAKMKSLRVDTASVVEDVTKEGQKLQSTMQSRVAMERPDKLRVERTTPNLDVVFRYDGKTFSVFSKRSGLYAVSPAPPQLDEAIDDARERLNIQAPAGDLLFRDPYTALTEGVTEGRYLGLEPMEDGSMAHHLAFREKDVDWQIWVKEGPEALPLRYVVTTKDLPGHPQATVEMRNWQANPRIPAEAFEFEPPPEAKQVEFLPVKK